MWTITRYIGRGFIVTFAVALFVITFVMSLGVLFKVTSLIARGAPWKPIVEVFAYSMPNALSLAIPVSTLLAALLVFGRLSADGEINAMRACGFSSFQIIAAPLAIAIALSILCIYINNNVVPRSHMAQRIALTKIGMESPLHLIEEGRFIQDFEGVTVFVGKKNGNHLSDIRIYDMRTRGINREIRARSGTASHDTNKNEIVLSLRDVYIDPVSDDKPWAAEASEYTMKIPLETSAKTYHRKEDDLSWAELVRYIRNIAEFNPMLANRDVSVPRMILAVELNKRLVLALSCVGFVLIGSPLGIKAHRKDSSIGVAISIFLLFNFFLFVIVAESLVKHPRLRPDLIVWLPVLLSFNFGFRLLRRMG